MKTLKEELEDWLTIIEKHLESAEGAFQKNDHDLAEAEVFQARDKIRHARATTQRISN